MKNSKNLLLMSMLVLTTLTMPSLAQHKDVALKLEPGSNNPRNSEGDFIKLKDGKILFIYSHYDGKSSGDHASAYLAGRYSGDEGKTWTKNDEVILQNEGDMNVMSVSLLRLQDSGIAMFYLRKNSTSDCIPMMRKSHDEAKTWSEPVPLIQDKEGYFVLNNDRVIQLDNGRLLAPVALHNTPTTAWSNGGKIFVYYSDDSGKTWKSSKEVPNPEGVVLQEPGVAQLQNGKVMMFIRTNEGVQYLSYSKSNGKTWSEAEPSNIVSPQSPASIERIPETGDLVMVWNNNLSEDEKKSKLRTPLNIAVSKDEGKNWQNVKTLENDPDGWYCYTAIDFVDDHILLGHCAGNRPNGTGLAVTRIARVNTDWLYQHQ